MHIGFVGQGMLDAACPGQIFTAPTPNQMVNAARALNSDAGTLFIVKNYPGDVMSFGMAAEMLKTDVEMVLVNDDVAMQASLHSAGRRGVAGTLIVEKMVGAAAERGHSLRELKILGDDVNNAIASMGVALSPCTVPAVGKPAFHMSSRDMELGVGIHGEPGLKRIALASADEIAASLIQTLLQDLSLKAADKVILLVNGFGGTPILELYLMANAARKMLNQANITVSRTLTGNYATALEMSGCSITLACVDEGLLELWDAPVHTSALRWGM